MTNDTKMTKLFAKQTSKRATYFVTLQKKTMFSWTEEQVIICKVRIIVSEDILFAPCSQCFRSTITLEEMPWLMLYYKRGCFLSGSDISVFAYQAGWLPELLCHSLMPWRSPREKGVVSRKISTAPLSNTHFFGSVRWCGSLFPSAPNRVTVT